MANNSDGVVREIGLLVLRRRPCSHVTYIYRITDLFSYVRYTGMKTNRRKILYLHATDASSFTRTEDKTSDVFHALTTYDDF